MTTSLPPLSSLTPLVGHTSTETAFVQPDYPYGRKLRCQRRVWIEYKQGHGMRFCTQTTDPRRAGEKWNAPKRSTYGDYICLLLDQSNGYVHPYLLSMYSYLHMFQEFWNLFYRQLDAFNQQQLDGLGMALVRQANNRYGLDKATPQFEPRIEVELEYFYDREVGVSSYVYAHQTGEGGPNHLPVVSAVKRRNDCLYPCLRPDEITDEVKAQARAIVGWSVTDYEQAHWCYAVLRGYRGFQWQGQPINDRVAELMVLADQSRKAQQPLPEYRQLWDELWNIAATYWQQQVDAQGQDQQTLSEASAGEES